MKNMTWLHWLSVAGVGVLAAVPHFMPIIPEPYRGIASGAIALVGALAHLHVTSPSDAVLLAAGSVLNKA